MATKKTKVASTEPEVIVGSHLTVTKYPDGRTELAWDDAALLRDVQEALDSVNKPNPKKATKKVKKAVEEVIEKITKPKAKATTKKEVAEEKPKKKETATKAKTTTTKAKKTK